MSNHFRQDEKIRFSLSRRPWTFLLTAPWHTGLIFLVIFDLVSGFNFGAHPHVAHMTGRNTPCLHCPSGFGLKFFCNATHDTVCEACEDGRTFSPGPADTPHMSSCQICSLCGPGLFVDRKCSPSSDTLCDSCETSHAPHTWNFYQSCLREPENPSTEPETGEDVRNPLTEPETGGDVPFQNDKSESSDRQIEFQLARDEKNLRRELNALKKTVNDEMIALKELGSAVNHVLQEDHQSQDSASKNSDRTGTKGSSVQSNVFEKNPNTILAIVLLSTFGALGLASMAGVAILIYVNRRKIKSDTGYGGVKTHSDGASLLTMENNDSEEDAMI